MVQASQITSVTDVLNRIDMFLTLKTQLDAYSESPGRVVDCGRLVLLNLSHRTERRYVIVVAAAGQAARSAP